MRCPSNTPRTMRVTYKVPNGGISYEYEKELERTNSDSEKLGDLLQVYNRFTEVLQQTVKEGRLTEYERQVIRDMTVKVVSSLVAKWSYVKNGVEDIMGGQILELEVDKIIIDTMISLVRDGLLDLAEGAKRANMTPEEFEQRVKSV